MVGEYRKQGFVGTPARGVTRSESSLEGSGETMVFRQVQAAQRHNTLRPVSLLSDHCRVCSASLCSLGTLLFNL